MEGRAFFDLYVYRLNGKSNDNNMDGLIKNGSDEGWKVMRRLMKGNINKCGECVFVCVCLCVVVMAVSEWA